MLKARPSSSDLSQAASYRFLNRRLPLSRGMLLVQFVDPLTDAKLIAAAERTEKAPHASPWPPSRRTPFRFVPAHAFSLSEKKKPRLGAEPGCLTVREPLRGDGALAHGVEHPYNTAPGDPFLQNIFWRPT
jgi:hypothetical protein